MTANGLNELGILDDSHSIGLQHFLNFLLDAFVLKGIRIDEWEILLHDIWLIVALLNMTLRSWNSKCDLLWLHASLYQALNAAIRVKSSAIDDAILNSLLVSQDVDESSTHSEMLVKVRIINAENLVCSVQQSRSCDAS